MILIRLLYCIVLSTGIITSSRHAITAVFALSFSQDDIIAQTATSNILIEDQRTLSSYTEVDFSASTVTTLDHEYTATKYQYFGSAMAIDAINGDFLIVGAPGDNFNTRYGAAYIYDIKTNELLSHLDTQILDDFFGAAVAISGSHTVVGAYK